ncbi:MAG: TA system VapC family ribonuclease toxin [Candidatus Limnocylindrales bacterium]
MLLDANLLLYAIDEDSPLHGRAVAWLTDRLAQPGRVGMPWESLSAFLRIATNPRASDRALSATDAWRFVRDWIDRPNVWIPLPTERHMDVLGGLIERYQLSGNMIPDARLAALAIEHGVTLYSADTDFARFTEIRWRNPLAA